VDSLAVKGSLCKKIEETDWRLYTGGTLAKKELRTGEVLKVDTAASWASLKMSTTILNSLAESRTPFLVEKVYSTPPFAALELFTYNLYLSADSLTRIVLQHLKQEEVAVVKEAYSAG
jgi:hypothetical protein